jgi:hypothetical protein
MIGLFHPMSYLGRITALAIRRTCVAARHRDECDESYRSRARSLRTPHNSAGKATLQLAERYFNRANQKIEGLVVPVTARCLAATGRSAFVLEDFLAGTEGTTIDCPAEVLEWIRPYGRTSSMILPMCALDSIKRCASAASASGKTR